METWAARGGGLRRDAFALIGTYDVGRNPLDLQLSDMDGDGDDDVVVLSSLNFFLFDNVTEDPLERSEGHKAFVRGDVNSDGRVDTTDIQQIARVVLPGDSAPACEKTLDADDNGKVEIFDAMRVASNLFRGLGALPAPSDRCDADPTAKILSCLTFSACPWLSA